MSFTHINKVILFFWQVLISIAKNVIGDIESTVAENSNESHYRNGNIYFISAQVKNYHHLFWCKQV
ncbi:hypothetical protein BB987_15825 [Photorhabdus temperata]|uniref:hypothetical protein n=1 Tax=Photorhabdus khanii TaxID=1004150 RepID=UPI0004AE5854|nr:hypothetical protein [Photorhabdus khanii]OHV51855.1 hypothetical protein BB987_15825 [Photorhabdus temperata]